MATNTTALPATVPATPGRWIGMGWAIVKGDLGNFILIALIASALWLVAGVTIIGHFVVGGPLITGFFMATRRRMLEGRMDVADLFSGFNLFLDSLLICLLTSLFEFAGLVLCIVPFFVVLAFYLFPYLFLIDRDLPFWDAMEASRKAVAHDIPGYMMFGFLLFLLNLAGLMLAGVGVLLTLPVSVAAVSVAYGEAVGFKRHTVETRRPIVIP